MGRPLLALAFVLIVWSPWLRAGDRWETIVSKEGGFTVDMPVKPMLHENGTSSGPNGRMRTFMLGCKTDDGIYFAFRIDFLGGGLGGPGGPGGFGLIDLDRQRDQFAKRWRGRVISDKRVNYRGLSGRDFTIQGRPDRLGLCTIRLREYLLGNSIFAVAVLSLPGRDLPEDTGRFLGSLAIGGVRDRASGTPAPEPRGRDLPGWGMAIDPDNDCKFTPGDRSMTIEVPATLHDLYFDNGNMSAPRVLREVEGDFTVTVKVVGEFKPGPNSTNPKSVPYHGGGILVWSDSSNNIRFERCAYLRDNTTFTQIAFQEREGGYGGANHNRPCKPGDCYLRLQRKGSRIYAGVSQDGNKWEWLRPIDTIWPAKLKVGLAAITTSSSPFVVKFEEYEFQNNYVAQTQPGNGFAPARPGMSPPPQRNPTSPRFSPAPGGQRSTSPPPSSSQPNNTQPFAPALPSGKNPTESPAAPQQSPPAASGPTNSASSLASAPTSAKPRSRAVVVLVIIIVAGGIVFVALLALGAAILWILLTGGAKRG